MERHKIFFQLFVLLAALFINSFFFRGDFNFLKKNVSVPPLKKNDYIPEPSVSASSTLVVRLNTGEALYQKNADEKRAIASLTKLMTGALLFEQTDPLALITFDEDTKKLSDPTAKKSEVPVGETIKWEDAAKLLLVESDNDAAFAIAEASSSVADFVRAMNQKAAEIGMPQTHFANPAGIDDSKNYSTAADLQKLIRYIYEKHNELWGITRTVAGEIISVSGKEYHFASTNQLLKEMPDKIYGGKTGMTDEAQGALILLYQPMPRETVSIIILGSRDRFQDARNIMQWLNAAFVWPQPKSK
ncbi:serine hydrolase [Patescibacteria group bacterium]|nr:serine hydrolase [Patescibacteria group bacterium]